MSRARLSGPDLKRLESACKIVERIARSIGPDNQIIFHDTGVQVAPLQWSGDVNAEDLFSALVEARESAE